MIPFVDQLRRELMTGIRAASVESSKQKLSKGGDQIMARTLQTMRPSRKRRTGILAAAAVAVVVILAVAVWPTDDPTETPLTRAGADAQPSVETWGALSPGAGADEVEYYEGLQEMTSGASLTVVGVVESVEPGRFVGEGDSSQYLVATLRVDSVLAGSGAQEGDSVSLEFGPMQPNTVEDDGWDPIVNDEGLFFLRLKGDGTPEFGTEDVESEMALGVYRVVSSQGLFLNDAGSAAPVLYAEPEGFPLEISGDPFESVVEHVSSFDD